MVLFRLSQSPLYDMTVNLVFTWGWGTEGQLGHGVRHDEEEARPVEQFGPDGPAIKAIGMGYRHAAAVGVDGCVWTWGNGAHGRLGHGDERGSDRPVRLSQCTMGTQLTLAVRMTSVSCGFGHTGALSETGFCFTWGYGGDGALGHGVLQNELRPRRVDTLYYLQTAINEDAQSSLTRLAGAVQDGPQSSMHDELRPTRLGTLQKLPAMRDGDAQSSVHDGRRERRVDTLHDLPTDMQDMAQTVTVTQFACGGTHSLALMSNGRVYSWGSGQAGRLGLGDEQSRALPAHVRLLPGHVTFLAAGHRSSLACAKGEAWWWGEGAAFGLGATISCVPKKLEVSGQVQAGAVGGSMSLLAGQAGVALLSSQHGSAHTPYSSLPLHALLQAGQAGTPYSSVPYSSPLQLPVCVSVGAKHLLLVFQGRAFVAGQGVLSLGRYKAAEDTRFRAIPLTLPSQLRERLTALRVMQCVCGYRSSMLLCQATNKSDPIPNPIRNPNPNPTAWQLGQDSLISCLASLSKPDQHTRSSSQASQYGGDHSANRAAGLHLSSEPRLSPGLCSFAAHASSRSPSPPPELLPTSISSLMELQRILNSREISRSPLIAHQPGGKAVRVYAMSDLHTDFKANLEWLQSLAMHKPNDYLQSVVIVAGDIADSLDLIEASLKILVSLFHSVFYCVGNHELWIRNRSSVAAATRQSSFSIRKAARAEPLAAADSISKFLQIRSTCARLGVWMDPKLVTSDLLIFPLLSWYHASLDSSARKSSIYEEHFDAACIWPAGLSNQDLSGFWLALNEKMIQAAESRTDNPPVCISFSHFLPRADLYYGRQDLLRVMGAPQLDAQIRRLRSRVHVYGHSHLQGDLCIEGVRYVQHALGSRRPSSAAAAPSFAPKCIWP
eukprot:g61778.t1